MIILYQDKCEGCDGRFDVARVKSHCKSHGIRFEKRQTTLYDGWKKEAESISDLPLPFLYSTASGESIALSFNVPIEKFIKLEKDAESKNTNL